MSTRTIARVALLLIALGTLLEIHRAQTFRRELNALEARVSALEACE